MHFLIAPVLLASLLIAATPRSAWALKVGDVVKSVKVKDASDNPAWIPDIGKKVITLFYTDPDVKDLNEPFRDRLKAAKLDLSRYRGVGVVNMDDTWKPNFAIRSVVRGKIKKFKALILTDPDHLLKRAWRLADCNEKDVVIIIGKDAKVRYLAYGAMSVAEQKRGLELVKKLMQE